MIDASHSPHDRQKAMFIGVADGKAHFDDGRQLCRDTVIIFFGVTRPDLHDYSEYAKAIEAFNAAGVA